MGITRAQLDDLQANLPVGCYLCGMSVAHFIGAIERPDGDHCPPGSLPSPVPTQRPLVFFRLCEPCRDRPGSAAEVAQKMTPDPARSEAV